MPMNRIDIQVLQSEFEKCKRVLRRNNEFVEEMFGDIVSPNMLFLWENLPRKYMRGVC